MSKRGGSGANSRVRMTTSLAPVDFVKVGEREAEFVSERLDFFSYSSFRQRGKFVEQRLDERREDGSQEELNDDSILKEKKKKRHLSKRTR